MVATIADEKINEEISKISARAKGFFQKFFVQAHYPNGVESSVKIQLIQDYFDYCQRQQTVSFRAEYYSAFIRYLTDQQCLPWFIQSILPQIIQKTLTGETSALAKSEQCERLLEFIENQLVQQVNPSSNLNAVLDQQRQLLSDCWIEQLVACRSQLMLPDEILAQRQILDVLDDKEGNRQAFVSIFDEVIESVRQIKLPSLVGLQRANSSLTALLMAVKEEKENIAKQYAALEKNYQNDLNALVQNQQAFIQDIDKRLEGLNELHQQVVDKKLTIFATLKDIKTNLGKSEFIEIENICQTYLDTVDKQFISMEEVTKSKREELVKEKQCQAADLQELIALRDNKDEPLLAEKMRTFRANQHTFVQTKKAINQLTTQIQTQVDMAQKSLLERAMNLKDTFGQAVTQIYQQREEVNKQQIEYQKQIGAQQHRRDQIDLELQICDQNRAAVDANIQLIKTELKQKEKELTQLSRETLEPGF